MSKIPCSVEILTRNSEKTLGRCLESIKDFDDIIVLVGNSTDKTREIAARYGARILKQYDIDEPNIQIKDYAEVRNKGLRLAKYDWFMFIDSDEYLSKEAAEEIRSITESQNPSADAFWQPRLYVLDGKIIKCATTYPNQQIRLFRRNGADGFIKPVHEKIKLKEGARMGILKNFEYVPIDPPEVLSRRWRRYMEAELKMVEGASRKKIVRLMVR